MNIMGSHGAAAAAAAAANNNNPSVDYLLSRQGSLYSLTLDEFQTQLGNHLGKPLSTMNLDELLRTVWIAESNSENNGSSSAAATVPPNHSIRLMPSSGSPPPSLHAQSSNHSLLPHDLCTKTVDQVWREINKKGNKTSNDTPGCDAGERSSEDRQQQTLGEMTLEDFLAQAGVISEVGANANCGGSGLMGIVVEPNAAQQHCQWIQYPAAAITQQQFMPSGGHQVGGGGQKAAAANTNLIMDSANLSDTAPLSPPSFILEVLSDTQAPVPLRKRVASKEVMVERTVERRQKRMIKNRESAARSRARKQAYTNELENKVSRLEEENKRLRRMKEVEKVLPSLPPPEPKCQLRRTNSGPL